MDRKLNLVIPIYGDERPALDGKGKPLMEKDGKTPVTLQPIDAYVHATPISRETFDRYFFVIAKTFAAIYNEGLGITAGPRVAKHMLRKTADELGVWDGQNGVEAGLMAEVRRLANVVANGTVIPLHDAIEQKILSEDDAAEVENAVVFFTLASAMHKKTELPTILAESAKLWGGRIESSTCTEFVASLPTSTAGASSGAKVTASPIPS